MQERSVGAEAVSQVVDGLDSADLVVGEVHRDQGGVGSHRGDERVGIGPDGRAEPVHRVARALRGKPERIAQHFGETEQAHGQNGEVDAAFKIVKAQRQAWFSGLDVGADGREQDAEEDHCHGFEERAARQHDREDEAHDHQREIFRGREFQRDLGARRTDRGDDPVGPGLQAAQNT